MVIKKKKKREMLIFGLVRSNRVCITYYRCLVINYGDVQNV